MKHRKGFGWILSGLLLIAAAFLLTAFNLKEEQSAKKHAALVLDEIEDILPDVSEEEDAGYGEDEIPDYLLNPDMEMPVKTIDGIDYIGTLSIPVLQLELPVISDWSYPKLRKAPCRYSGSVYTGNLILAGHNYASHFGNLKKLWEKDTVLFTDMDGNVFCYEVAEQEILKPSDTEAMEEGDWDLTLFTCTPGGRSRVTVRCVRVGE